MTDKKSESAAENEARAAYDATRVRLEAYMETLETPAEKVRAIDELRRCGEAFAAWERAEIAAGVPPESLRPLNVAFWRWAFVCLGAIRAGASIPRDDL
jgi:hypothetical protein